MFNRVWWRRWRHVIVGYTKKPRRFNAGVNFAQHLSSGGEGTAAKLRPFYPRQRNCATLRPPPLGKRKPNCGGRILSVTRGQNAENHWLPPPAPAWPIVPSCSLDPGRSVHNLGLPGQSRAGHPGHGQRRRDRRFCSLARLRVHPASPPSPASLIAQKRSRWDWYSRRDLLTLATDA